MSVREYVNLTDNKNCIALPKKKTKKYDIQK